MNTIGMRSFLTFRSFLFAREAREIVDCRVSIGLAGEPAPRAWRRTNPQVPEFAAEILTGRQGYNMPPGGAIDF
jgi:hypothetical protein